MAESRINREQQSRQSDERPKQWAPPDLLPEPDMQPGFAYRWVRSSIMNNADPRNLSSKMREGWEPVPVEEQPHMKFFLDPHSNFKGNVEVGGLLLCKAPKEMIEQRDSYYRNQSQNQEKSVDNSYMSQSDPRMPLYKESSSKVRFGKGS